MAEDAEHFQIHPAVADAPRLLSDEVRQHVGEDACLKLEGEHATARLFVVQSLQNDHWGGCRSDGQPGLPLDAASVAQATLRRVLQLSDAVVLTLNHRLTIPPFSCARAALETACVAYDAWTQLEPLSRGMGRHLEFDKAKQHFRRLYYSARAKHIRGMRRPREMPLPEMPLRMGAVVARVDRLMARVGVPEDHRVLHIYEALSEHAHPNGLWLLAPFLVSNPGAGLSAFADPWTNFPVTVGVAMRATTLSLYLTRNCVHLLDVHRERLIAACMKDQARRNKSDPRTQ